MSHSIQSLCAAALLLIGTACNSNDGEARISDPFCAPGQSIACSGPGSCQGFQICRDDGSGYDPCNCSSHATGTDDSPSTRAGTNPFVAGSGGSPLAQASNSARANGGALAASTGAAALPNGGAAPATGWSTASVNVAGGTATTLVGSGAGSPTSSSVCAPTNMASYAYPPYKPARRQVGSCTAQDLQKYYDECYAKGSCAAFQTGGGNAACGACLAPTSVDSVEYGPLIRLGAPGSSLDITNMAGCLETLGETDCAKPTMVASLCDYYACANTCPATETSSYQAQMSCMATAHNSTCGSAWNAAVCIRDPAHAATCSGSGFLGQFLAVARVFCVQND